LLVTDFRAGVACVEIDIYNTSTVDMNTPPVDSIHFHLIRAENECPTGQGTLGTGFDSTPRTGGPYE